MEPNKSYFTPLLLFSIIPITYYAWISKQEKQEKQEGKESLRVSTFDGVENGKIRPPFPPVIRNMLSSCRLAYLSTVQENSSHLSLMRFTYINDKDDGEVIIMTTRRETKKFNMLKKQNGVALLIHDFPQFGEHVGTISEEEVTHGVHSITLNGKCAILEGKDEKAEIYRAKHLQHNPDYPQFIVGPDISVLCITITSARICNIDDKVTKWNVKDC